MYRVRSEPRAGETPFAAGQAPDAGQNYALDLRPGAPPAETRPQPIPTAAKIPGEGLLVGWSLEHEYRRRRWPIGFLGGPRYRSVAPSELRPILHDGPGHLMTIAATGAGKGVGCVVPALLRHRGPVIVIDPKGENYAITARARREMGQQVVVLDPFGVTGAPATDRLNPLDAVPDDTALAVDECAGLADMVVTMQPGHPDPFWDNKAREYIAAVMMHTALEKPEGERHLGTIRATMNLSQKALEEAFQQMMQSRLAEVRMVASGCLATEPKVRASITTTAQFHLECFRGEAVLGAMRDSTLTLDAITRGDPVSVYIVIPPHRLSANARVLRLWIGVLMEAILQRRAAPPNRTLFLLDEAAQLGRLELLKQAITLLRGYGLQTWSFWQDVSQLKHLYPYDWETMYNNCRVHQNFGVTNARSAHSVAELTGINSWREVLELDHDELLLQQAGKEVVIAQRPNYLTDRSFGGTFDPNPFHSRDEEQDVAALRPQRLGGSPSLQRGSSRPRTPPG